MLYTTMNKHDRREALDYTSTSRRRISDFLLPFLIDPWLVYVPLWNYDIQVSTVLRRARRAQHTSKYNSPLLRYMNGGLRLNSEKNAPVRKLGGPFGVLQDDVEEVFDRVSHVHRRKLTVRVASGTDATELQKIEHMRRPKNHWDLLTFSNILERGPPPPSPLPNTSNEMSDDSRF